MAEPAQGPKRPAAARRPARPRHPRGARSRADEVRSRLTERYPDVRCALEHRNAFELLGATILSAQCTDERVNMVTPALFARFPTPGALAAAPLDEVERLVRSTGFYRAKAKNLVEMAQALEGRFDGEVPTDLEDLVTVPGVGRKTANVVRSVAFGLPGLPVDTHVGRLSVRLRLTTETDPVKAEMALNDLVPPDERGRFSLRLIEHGRQVCAARKPRCDDCMLADLCPAVGTFAPAPRRAAGTAKAPGKAAGKGAGKAAGKGVAKGAGKAAGKGVAKAAGKAAGKGVARASRKVVGKRVGGAAAGSATQPDGAGG